MDGDRDGSPGAGEAVVRRLLAVIADSRPAAVAGWPAYWAELAGLELGETTTALETLADRGVLRRQALGGRILYIADPPHAYRTGHP